MTTATPETPAAAPAAPAAPVTETPAAPVAAAPAAPAAPETPAAPVAAKPASLFADAPAEPAKAGEKPAEKPAEAETPTWFYADGTPGKGEKPDWFKADKYQTVDQQAKAYAELEKRFGAFKGAPKDGKYAPPPAPEGLEGEFVVDHPVMGEFSQWAAANQLSQDGYNQVLGLLAKYEAARVPDPAEVKARLGDNADERISAAAQWAKANLDADTYKVLQQATSGDNAAEVFKVVEALIAKNRVVVPKPGDDVTVAKKTGVDRLREMHSELLPDGRRRYEVDANWRIECDKMALQVANAKAA
jgi:hypothetical protein